MDLATLEKARKEAPNHQACELDLDDPVKRGASDITSSYELEMRVRFRIDGSLHGNDSAFALKDAITSR